MELSRHFRNEPVSRLQPTPAWHVSPTQVVADAVQLMREKKIGCVLVTLERRIVGIFTERDLVRRVLARGSPLATPMSACMTKEPVTIHAREPILHAIKLMLKGGYRHLPVVNDEGRAIGVLSVKRIVHYVVEHFPGTVYNLPPVSLHGSTAREGP